MSGTTAILIYKRSVDNEGNTYNQALRKVNVHSSFEGFGKSGKTIHSKFDELVKDLEPSSTSWVFLN